jgi:DsbC/DsbD-like thiol-disulfide interchange protein/cytochrome c biogenesis protein CcdA
MNRLLAALILLILALPAPASAQLAPGEKAMTLRLEAETASAAPGATGARASVRSPKPGWHGYWQNPGDAGVGTRVAGGLPAGAAPGPIRYPVPGRLFIQGLMNYVFEGEHALLVDLKLPAGVAAGTRRTVHARADYLVCTDKICVPESAELSTEIEIGAGGGSRSAAFDRYREALPKPLGVPARFERKGDLLRIGVPLPESVDIREAYFFPQTEGALVYSAPQSASRNGDWLIVETMGSKVTPSQLQGVLALGEGIGLSLTALPGGVPAVGKPLATAPAATPSGGLATVLTAFLGAMLGGLILNIIPCVFPILSLKALSLARAGGGDEGAARREALAYAAGAVLACLALGGVLLAVRAGGAAVGWAFQLQDPRVILLLLLLVTAITLNLAGLFELPSIGTGGRGGAFWTGALAAFVATPCTGPFMGAALGAAIVLPPLAALAVFGGLGLGLALPFLLLGFVPALRRRLPRPGAWMLGLRRIMALPMGLTALGLAWILERQIGKDGLALGLGAAGLVAAALWIGGRRQGWLPLAPAALAAALAVALLPVASTPAAAGRRGITGAEPFSEARLAALRSKGRPVFVYFTADWCLTCKVNEKTVLERGEAATAFAGRGAAILVGDWTRGDAAIGRFLEKQGRSGVPLYLWYPARGEPQVLPQILTVSRINALRA